MPGENPLASFFHSFIFLCFLRQFSLTSYAKRITSILTSFFNSLFYFLYVVVQSENRTSEKERLCYIHE